MALRMEERPGRSKLLRLLQENVPHHLHLCHHNINMTLFMKPHPDYRHVQSRLRLETPSPRLSQSPRFVSTQATQEGKQENPSKSIPSKEDAPPTKSVNSDPQQNQAAQNTDSNGTTESPLIELGTSNSPTLYGITISESKTVWVRTDRGVFSFPAAKPDEATWVTELRNERFSFLKFYDQSHGWACSDQTVYFTENAGIDWKRCNESILPPKVIQQSQTYTYLYLKMPHLVGADTLIAIKAGVLYQIQCQSSDTFVFSESKIEGNGKDYVHWCVARMSNSAPSRVLELYAKCGNAIYHSLNQGKSWAALSSKELGTTFTDQTELRDMQFFNESEGQLSVFDKAKHATLLLQTKDGGASWKPVSAVDGRAVIQLCCDTNGVWFGLEPFGKYTLYKSSDKGKTWGQITRNLEDLSWLVPQESGGVVIGFKRTYGSDSQLWDWKSRTIDEALKWEEIGVRFHGWGMQEDITPKPNFNPFRVRMVLHCDIGKDVARNFTIQDIQVSGFGSTFLLATNEIVHVRDQEIVGTYKVEPKKGETTETDNVARFDSFGAWQNSDEDRCSIIAIGVDQLGNHKVYFKRANESSFQQSETYSQKPVPADSIVNEADDSASPWRMLGVAMLSEERAIMAGLNGKIAETTDGGASWKEVASPTEKDLVHICCSPKNRSKLWACGSDGTLIRSIDGGATWEPPKPTIGHCNCLNKVLFVDDQHGVIAGDNETLVVTKDGGESWHSARQYSQHPPKMSYWLLVAGIFFGLIGYYYPLGDKKISANSQSNSKDSIAQQYANDSPITEPSQDRMDSVRLAKGISAYLVHEKTTAPLTLAITGEWGSGKSSLMNLIKRELELNHWQPVWFNAWHFQNEENLLAALLQAVRCQAVPKWWSLSGFRFRMSMVTARVMEHPFLYTMQLFVCVVCACAAIFHWNETMVVFKTVLTVIEKVSDKSGWSKQLTGTGIVGAPLIILLLSTYKAFKYLQPFNTNPIDLVRTIRGSNKELEDKTTFRDRFADNFKLVARCMSPSSLVIFVDDLDRCQPDNVMTVLQAINFLVSSGDCYVVLGMAMPRIEEAIAIERSRHTTSAKIELKETPHEFAANYLEKLVQLTIPTVEARSDQARQIAHTETDKQPKPRVLKQILPRLKLVGIIALFGLIVSSAIFAGMRFTYLPLFQDQNSQSNLPNDPKPELGKQLNDPKAEQGNRVGPGTADGNNGNNIDTLPNPTEFRGPDRIPLTKEMEQSMVEETNQRLTYGRWWRHLIVDSIAMSLLAIFMFLFIRQAIAWALGQSMRKDSQAFVNAIEAWLPLFLVKERRPRLVKRLINKARLYSMLSDPEPAAKNTTNSDEPLDPELIVAFTILTEKKAKLFEGGSVNSNAIVDCVNSSIAELDLQTSTLEPKETENIRAALEHIKDSAKSIAERFNQEKVLKRLLRLKDVAKFVNPSIPSRIIPESAPSGT